MLLTNSIVRWRKKLTDSTSREVRRRTNVIAVPETAQTLSHQPTTTERTVVPTPATPITRTPATNPGTLTNTNTNTNTNTTTTTTITSAASTNTNTNTNAIMGTNTNTNTLSSTVTTGNGKKMQQDWQLSHKYTLSEVQQHSLLDDCWMVIFDKVYNITEFVNEHPGGDFILLEYAGRDATHPFLSSRHGSSAYKMLDKYWIGILVDEELYYSNNSSYCSVYSSLSWRSTPTLEEPVKMSTVVSSSVDTTTETTLDGYEDEDELEEEEDDDDDEDDDDNQSDLSDESDAWTRAITRTAGQALSQALASRKWFPQR